jgi:acetylornithine/succinyldiaminopimelate/putrescine aminotransferase
MDELLALRKLCDKHGIVLIFDEIITGFRYRKLSVALDTNILPDLILLGKAMANGLPLAAVGGKAAILDGDYFVSSTYAGEILSLTATQAVLNILVNKRYPDYNLDKLWEYGERFIKKFNQELSPHLELVAYPTRGVFKGDDLVKACFMEKAIQCKILTGPSWFYNFDLIKEDFNFFQFVNEFKHYLARGDLRITSRMPTSAFASRSRR